jgi:hypothetical protein
LKIRKCVTLIIIFLSIDPIYRICENRSFTYLFSNQQEEGGTFLSEEQICNCAVVPSHNVNGIKVKFFKKEPEIKIGAALQIFLEKENVPLLPSHRKNLYLKQ